MVYEFTNSYISNIASNYISGCTYLHGWNSNQPLFGCITSFNNKIYTQWWLANIFFSHFDFIIRLEFESEGRKLTSYPSNLCTFNCSATSLERLHCQKMKRHADPLWPYDPQQMFFHDICVIHFTIWPLNPDKRPLTDYACIFFMTTFSSLIKNSRFLCKSTKSKFPGFPSTFVYSYSSEISEILKTNSNWHQNS